MGLLKHSLGGLACAYFARRPRRPLAPARTLTAKAQERRRKHVERCAACRARQQREREYLERLRAAAVPAASSDLTARLLARTSALAAGQDTAGHSAADTEAAPQPGRPERKSQRPPHRPLGLAVRIAGGAAATAALMGGAAYVMGGDTALPARDALSAAFPGTAPSGPAMAAASVSGAAWQLSSEPDVAPPGSLTAEQLAALQSGGWACPELRELGYHLVWARGTVANGSEVLELRLTDGSHFATVLEQHTATEGAAGQPAKTAAAPPINVLTGHPATEDGFVAARAGAATPAEYAAVPAGALWVNPEAPFRAIYRTPGATFTYVSDLPAEQADDALGALVHGRPGQAAKVRGTEEMPARLERGLGRIVELLAR